MVTTAPVLHTTTADGTVRHYFVREGSVWVCECGATRTLDAAITSAKIPA